MMPGYCGNRCGHCKSLAPTWKELADAYAANPRIKVAKVDCTEHSAICQKHEVSSWFVKKKLELSGSVVHFDYHPEIGKVIQSTEFFPG